MTLTARLLALAFSLVLAGGAAAATAPAPAMLQGQELGHSGGCFNTRANGPCCHAGPEVYHCH